MSIDLPLAGLECAVRAGQARRTLLRLDGVSAVTLNALTSLATLYLGRDGARLREIKSALRRAGLGHGEVVQGAASAGAERWRAAEARRATLRIWCGLPLVLLVWLPLALHWAPSVVEPVSTWLGQAAASDTVIIAQGVLAALLLVLHARMLWRGLAGILRGAPEGASLSTLAAGVAWLWGVLLLSVPDLAAGQAGAAGRFFAVSAAVLWLHGVNGALFDWARQSLWARVGHLHALQPDTAEVLGEDGLVELPASELRPGDRVLVAAGRRVPADGDVVDGVSQVDESLFTGRAATVERGPGQGVLAGTLNLTAPMTVRVSQGLSGTLLHELLARLETALGAEPPGVLRAERAAGWSARLATGMSVVAVLGAWALAAAPADALLRGLAVLAVALPATLAWPTVLAAALAMLRAADGGRLIAGGGALARLAEVDLLVVPRSALAAQVAPAPQVRSAAGNATVGVPAGAVEALQALGRLGVEVLLRDDAPPTPHTALTGIGAAATELGDLAAQQAQGRRVAALHLAPGRTGAAPATAEAWMSCGADAAGAAVKATDAEAVLLRGGLARLPGLLRGVRSSQRLVLVVGRVGPAFGLAGMVLAALWPGTPQPALAALAGTACVGLLLGLAILAGRRRAG